MTLKITAEEYNRFRDMLERSSGITLGEGKEYLVSSRLRRMMDQNALRTISDLLRTVETNRKLQEEVIDAMTTNETLWFRDEHPYRIFRERLLPEMAATRRPLRIWSAACSTGQEPYSLSIEIEEYRKRNMGSLMSGERILATDISPSSLAIAREGTYQQLAIRRGMSDQHLKSYFHQLDSDRWQIDQKIKARVEFRSQNLQQNFSGLGKFDIIFCRNVLIYFSADLKYDILKRMHACLNPKGYLLLGASESLNNLGEYFDMVQCFPGIIYRAR
ncbi:CheR family methyltransferase [Parathalassolituus penaei]|uniref:protein-glutamate O-methyltransferase n=1 Tax=Parathalassolituus penaei TaxID=2997323 RepID=A0A9X3EEU8_9GAMM|nr:protein-glutamate O-methyltransferase CheR [Parathalassolituus penaei]MCY0965910.1 protein-glutamate O-methyltransferase CheR [Parathalassolituus penaei]